MKNALLPYMHMPNPSVSITAEGLRTIASRASPADAFASVPPSTEAAGGSFSPNTTAGTHRRPAAPNIQNALRQPPSPSPPSQPAAQLHATMPR